MTNEELDAFCAEHVMGYQIISGPEGQSAPVVEMTSNSSLKTYQTFQPTICPAAAMMVLEKCAEKLEKDSETTCTGVLICAPDKRDPKWMVASNGDNPVTASASTLPLALAKFAKSLFETKEGK